VLAAAVWIALTATAATSMAQQGRIERLTVHGASLEESVTGESPDRRVSVYLPPGYDEDADRRYAVIYLLHGIGDTDDEWVGGSGEWNNIRSVMDGGIAERRFGEMIVVMPDEKTTWFGSFYVNSTVNGKWEDFTVRELVAYVDEHYRTLPTPGSRGIAGHSMGGYGAFTLGMKHPDVFSVVFAMNPALLGWGGELPPINPAFSEVLEVSSPEELLSGKDREPPYGYLDPYGWESPGVVTVARAFSPNPDRPPFYADFPFEKVDGRLRPAEPAYSAWESRMPVYIVDEYRENLVKLRGLRFDTGRVDEYRHIPITSRELSERLSALAVPHVFEEYNGDHRDRLWGRNGRLSTEVIPYFWLLLDHGK